MVLSDARRSMLGSLVFTGDDIALSLSLGLWSGGSAMSELKLWRTNLILDWRRRAPKPLLANAITALREAPAWQGVLAYDQFALETVVTDTPPWHMGLAVGHSGLVVS